LLNHIFLLLEKLLKFDKYPNRADRLFAIPFILYGFLTFFSLEPLDP
jgi:hypothetical protein